MKCSSPPTRRTPLRRGKPPTRKTRPKPVNRKRKASEFKRCYGSKARVLFVQSLGCAGCGFQGTSENAHLLGNDGAGRKGPYTEIGPLCSYRPSAVFGLLDAIGCHTLYDTDRFAFFLRCPSFDAEKVAADTQAAWEAVAGSHAEGTE